VLSVHSPARRSATRTRILDAAAHAFRANGYAATGVDEVMSAAGMTHGGFYAHFRSKAAMLAATMLHLRQPRYIPVETAIAGLVGSTLVAAAIDSYLTKRHRDHPEDGCPIPTLGAELPRLADGPANAAAPHVQGFVRLLAPHLPSAEAGRDDRAQALVALLVGGIVTARTLPDRQAGPWLEACRRAARRIAGLPAEST
jgi:TetR/AcrR family transcriptional regulator, transcriptional repressor for nem operon